MLLFLDISLSSLTRGVWPIALPVLLGLVAICLLLPRPRRVPTLAGAFFAGAALLAALWFLIRGGGLNPETVLFYAFAAIAITAGALLVTQRNPARAALSFALVVLATCGLFLLQAAPFLMAATIIVYAGAIIVTFLFVLMLAQQAGRSDADHRSREPVLASTAGFVLLGAVLYTLSLTRADGGTTIHPMLAPVDLKEFDVLLERARRAKEQDGIEAIQKALGGDFNLKFQPVLQAARGAPGASELSRHVHELQHQRVQIRPDAAALHAAVIEVEKQAARVRQTWDEHGRAKLPAENVAHLGRVLFTDYLLAVELGGTLLLVATIGAIAITARRTEGAR
jgi:NADH:ubiquinone oxidoreductase subunit 6 (subunit J)